MLYTPSNNHLCNPATDSDWHVRESLRYLAKAIDGFVKYKTAKGLIQRTIPSYEFTLGHWLNYIGDRDAFEIQSSALTSATIIRQNQMITLFARAAFT